MTVNGALEHMCTVLMETITGETGLGIIMELKLHGKQSKNLQIYKWYFKNGSKSRLIRYDWMRNEPNDWHQQNCLIFLKDQVCDIFSTIHMYYQYKGHIRLWLIPLEVLGLQHSY